MAKRKKKRTSIRTAAGTAQEKFLEKVRSLADDPLRVLPDCPDGEPPSIAKIRKGLEKIADGKIGFLHKRDKGVVGAVAHTVPLAELESVPRLVDHKVAGRRRFFLMRGQVARGCMLGVQNHTDARVLLMAYRDLAKAQKLHFFANDRVTCTGKRPMPPESWWQYLGAQAGITWDDQDVKTCGHADRDLLELSFEDGPSMAACGRCGPESGNLHDLVKQLYAGPRERRPVQVYVRMGGVAGPRLEVERELLAQYRGGAFQDRRIIRDTIAAWRASHGGYSLASRRFDDQASFLAALDIPDGLHDAVAVMTRQGHHGDEANLAAVLRQHAEHLPAAAESILAGASKLAARHGGEPLQALQDVLAQKLRQESLAQLPAVQAGPVGSFLDHFVRALRADGKRAGLEVIRHAPGDVPRVHVCACLHLLGGDLSLDARFDAEEHEAAGAIIDLLRPLLKATGKDYVAALERYLRQSGSGERVRT